MKTQFGKINTVLVVAALIVIILLVAALNRLHLPQLGGLKGFSAPTQKTLEVNREVVKEQSQVIDVVKKSSPSVVAVSAVGQRPTQSRLFGPFQGQSDSQEVEESIGTGFVVSSDGLIVTNKHVVSLPNVKYVVITNDDKKHDVANIYRDPENDLAILKLADGTKLTPLALGDSSKIEPGQFAIAIGNALGEFKNTVTTGVISGLGRAITAGDFFGGYQEKLDNLVQTDAAINPGNSGGPLMDIGGNVIGVNVAVSASAQNIGFAIPINTVKETVDRFNTTGQFSRPFLGVSHQQIDRRTALLNNVPEGAFVDEVVPDSSAAKAGIQANDIITKINGQPVNQANGGLASMIGKFKVGDTIDVTLYRDDKEQTVKVTLQEAPNQ